MQDDAADFLHLILKEISDKCLIDYSNFDSKAINISGSSMCEKIVSSIASNICLHLVLPHSEKNICRELRGRICVCQILCTHTSDFADIATFIYSGR